MNTTEEILSEMAAVQAGFPVLSGLDSTSDVSFFSQLRKMWALLIQIIQGAQDQFRNEIEALIAETSVGSLGWYVDQAKLFQLGDTISILNGKVSYDVIDDQKKIVAQAAITEDPGGRLTLKASKLGLSGLQPLSVEELAALKSYVGQVKYAGVVCDVISIDADHLKLVGTVKIDRQVLNSSGALLSNTSVFPVQDAIRKYIAYLPDTSALNITGLTDTIQKVKGVKDFTVTGSFSRRPVSDTWVSFSREVISPAGTMTLHNDSTINYIF